MRHYTKFILSVFFLLIVSQLAYADVTHEIEYVFIGETLVVEFEANRQIIEDDFVITWLVDGKAVQTKTVSEPGKDTFTVIKDFLNPDIQNHSVELRIESDDGVGVKVEKKAEVEAVIEEATDFEPRIVETDDIQKVSGTYQTIASSDVASSFNLLIYDNTASAEVTDYEGYRWIRAGKYKDCFTFDSGTRTLTFKQPFITGGNNVYPLNVLAQKTVIDKETSEVKTVGEELSLEVSVQGLYLLNAGPDRQVAIDVGSYVQAATGGNGGALEYTSSNTDVATADNTGKITLKALGDTTITVTEPAHHAFPAMELPEISDTSDEAEKLRDALQYELTVVGSIEAVAKETKQELTQYFSVPDDDSSKVFSSVTGGTHPLIYEIVKGILPDGVSFNSDTGKIEGIPTTVNKEPISVTFRVKDANNKVAQTTSTVPFVVNDTIVAAANPQTTVVMTVGAEPNFSPFSNVSGGAPPYTYEIASGSLPSVVSLNASTGKLSDAPTTANATATEVTFKVKDSQSDYAETTSTVSFTVNPVVTATSGTNSIPELTQDVKITPFTPLTANEGGYVAEGSSYTYFYTVPEDSSFPAGLKFNPKTGEVSGTPTEPCEVTLTFKVKDDNGAVSTTTSTVKIKVNGPLEATANTETELILTKDAEMLAAFQPLVASGGTTDASGNYTYSYDGEGAGDASDIIATLGLSFDKTTGEIYGTPNDELTRTAVTFHVKDINAFADTTSTIYITVNDVVTVDANDDVSSTQEFTEGTPITPFSPLGTPSGGTTSDGDDGGYTYYCDPDLPAGLYLDPDTGELSGTPTEAPFGPTEITFYVKDENGAVSDTNKPITFTINADISATAASITKQLTMDKILPTEGIAMFTEVKDGTPFEGDVYLYKVKDGTLPLGLDLGDYTGLITGTPKGIGSTGTTGTVTVTFTVEDKNGAVAKDSNDEIITGEITFILNGELTATKDETAQTLTLNTAIKEKVCRPLTASGGTPDVNGKYTYEVTSASTNQLPTDMDIDADGYITGAPSDIGTGTFSDIGTGTFNVTFQVSDDNGAIADTTATVKFTVNEFITAEADTTAQKFSINKKITDFKPFSSVSGGTPDADGHYIYTVISENKLPEGLDFADDGSGNVTGTPTETCTDREVTFQVEDVNGAIATTTSTVKITVNGPISATKDETALTLTKGTAMSEFKPLVARGGTKPYVYYYDGQGETDGSDIIATLGLSFDTSTGEISGTPNKTQTETSVTFHVKDANDVIASETATVKITVNDVVTATNKSLELTKDIDMDNLDLQSLVSGGTAPYTYTTAYDLGSKGLALAGSILSGKATVAELFDITFTITDANSASTTTTVSFKVNDTLSATNKSLGLTQGTDMKTFNLESLVSGGTAPYTYEVQTGSLNGLALNDGVLSDSTTATADFEITFKITDANSASTTATVSFTVNDILSATNKSLGLTQGTDMKTFNLESLVSGGTAPYTYEVQTGSLNGLALNDGVLSDSTTATADFEITFKITDENSATTTATVSFTVNDVLSATNKSLGLTQGADMKTFNLESLVSGGTAPYTYEVQTGSLNGLALNDGVLSDSTTATADFEITFKITDENSATTTATVSFTVNDVLSATNKSLGLTQGTDMKTFNLESLVSGGTAPYTYEVQTGSLNGLALNDGVLSDSTTATADFEITFKITDENSATTTATVSFTVNDVLSATNKSLGLTQGTDMKTFNLESLVSGGTAPYTYEVQTGSLNGLALNDGVLSDSTTTTADFEITFKITDENSATTTATVSFTVNDVLSATNKSLGLTQGTDMKTFNLESLVSGGTAPYTYEVQTGSLNGLALNDGVLSDSTTATADFEITFKITDENSATTTATVSFTVNDVLSATNKSLGLTQGTDMKTFNLESLVSGGTAPYTYEVQTGSLNGLALNDGVLSDSTTATADFEITFKITDENSATTTATVSFTVNDVLSATNKSLGLTQGTDMKTFNLESLVSGGTAPYTYEVQTGSLNGLALNDGVLSDSTTATADFEITFKITDENSATTTATVSFTVNDVLSATNKSLGLTQGTDMKTFNLESLVSGGTAPYTYEVQTGSLNGLALNDGVLSDSTTTTADFEITFKITDENSATTTATVSFTVNDVLSATNKSLGLTQGTDMKTFNLESLVSGGTAPYTYEVQTGSLNGLALNDGVLSDSTTATADFDVTFKITDENSATTTTTVSFTVNDALSADNTSLVLTQGVNMDEFDLQSLVSGGTAPYTYEVQTGSLNGLALNDGVLSGSTTATAEFEITFKITDENSASTTTTVTFAVYTPLTATPNTADRILYVGDSPSFSPFTSVSGGTEPYTYKVVSTNQLPQGLNLSNGQITGTTTSTYSEAVVEVQVKDSKGVCASLNSTIKFAVYKHLSVQVASIPAKEVVQEVAMESFFPFSSVTGGKPDLVYKNDVALPDGISLNSATGEVSGTPSPDAAENLEGFDVVFTVQDQNGEGEIATESCTVNFKVYKAFAVTKDTTAQACNVNRDISDFSPLTVTGGSYDCTYSYEGDLGGLDFNTTTGVVSGHTTGEYEETEITFSVTDNRLGHTDSCTVTFSSTVYIPPAMPEITITLRKPISSNIIGEIQARVDTVMGWGEECVIYTEDYTKYAVLPKDWIKNLRGVTESADYYKYRLNLYRAGDDMNDPHILVPLNNTYIIHTDLDEGWSWAGDKSSTYMRLSGFVYMNGLKVYTVATGEVSERSLIIVYSSPYNKITGLNTLPQTFTVRLILNS